MHNKNRYLALTIGAFPLVLSACNLPILGQGSMTLVQQVGFVVDGAKLSCNYIPAVASIASILGVSGAPKAEKLVSDICDQVRIIPDLEASRGRARDLQIELPQGVVQGVLLPR